MAYDFCKRLESDGTGYADVIVNPTHWSGCIGALGSVGSDCAIGGSLTYVRTTSTPAVSCALNTGRSPAPRRTGQVDPLQTFKIGPVDERKARESGLRLKP